MSILKPVLLIIILFSIQAKPFAQGQIISVCPGDIKIISSGLTGSTFSWQIFKHGGFQAISDNDFAVQDLQS